MTQLSRPAGTPAPRPPWARYTGLGHENLSWATTFQRTAATASVQFSCSGRNRPGTSPSLAQGVGVWTRSQGACGLSVMGSAAFQPEPRARLLLPSSTLIQRTSRFGGENTVAPPLTRPWRRLLPETPKRSRNAWPRSQPSAARRTGRSTVRREAGDSWLWSVQAGRHRSRRGRANRAASPGSAGPAQTASAAAPPGTPAAGPGTERWPR